MSSPKAGLRDRLMGKIRDKSRDRSQDKHQMNASKPVSTVPSDRLLAVNVPQIPVLATLDHDCQDTPIRELWNVAYERLREDENEAKLIKKYESSLEKYLPTDLGSVLSSDLSRREWMDAILQQKMEETQAKIWKLTLGGSEIQPTEVVQKVLGVLKLVNDFVTAAVSSNPSASLAWAGVGVLLPLFLNPIEQASDLADGLEYISSLIVQSRMREDLYHRRYESNSPSEASTISKAIYKNTLAELYRQILRFQVTSYCYYTHNEASRFGRDFVKLDDWSTLIEDIRTKDSHFINVNQLLHEDQYNDECLAAKQRHEESIHSLTAVGAELSSLKKAIQDANSDKDFQDLMRWLSDVDPSPIYNSALNRHEAGTSQWLLKSNEKFSTWRKSSRSLIWLHGKAGSGKSILSASVIQYLKDKYDEDSSVAVAYFYFSFSDQKKQKRDGMLRSLIKQICCQRPNMPESVGKLKGYKSQGTQPPTSALEQSLLDAMCGFSATYLIIDALDECPMFEGERAGLMKSLDRILTATAATTTSNLCLFCTSRNESDIKTEFLGHLSKPENEEIDLSSCKEEMEQDIGRYIDTTLSSPAFNSWPQTIQTEVKENLIKNSDGMFQYVRCQFDNLQRFNSLAEIRRALAELPQGLDETYERILRNIDSIHKIQVARCLQWLAFSFGRLTINELAEVFTLQPEKSTIIDEDERFFNPEHILSYLPGFIIVEMEKKTKFVRLSHYSIKEYLTSGRICEDLAPAFALTTSSAHLCIARSSLAYVLYMAATCKIVENLEKFSSASVFHHECRDSLKWYTAQNWPRHLEKIPHKLWPIEVANMAKSALSIRSQGLIITLLVGDLKIHDGNLEHPYYFTAESGYFQLTELLLTNKYLTQEDMDTMLRGAAGWGNKKLVLCLLERAAAINTESVRTEYQKYGALQMAVKRGDPDIVKILLGNLDTDTNTQREIWSFALQAAAKQQGLEMLELLIDHGADINSSSNAEGCVLSSAASRRQNTGHLEFLLAKGADINMRGTGKDAKTALHEAATRGYWNNYDLLLQRGADISIGGRLVGYILHGLVESHYDVDGALVRMRRLVEMGADPKAQCEGLGSALHVACASYIPDSIRIAEFLVDHGAGVNDVGGCSGTPLQACARSGNVELAEWLLANEADVNVQGGDSGSALQAACQYGKLEMVQLLLANKADVNVQGGIHGNALQAACVGGDLEMVQLLLAHGADVNAQGGEYGSALQAVCSQRRSTTIARLLLEGGADVNATGGRFGTALQAAAWSKRGDYDDDNIETIHLLLEHGADVRIQGGSCGNALNAAVSAHDSHLLQLLLEHGAHVNQVSGEVGTALHSVLAMQRTTTPPWVGLKDLCISKIRFLLEYGADINLAGGKYGLPLQSACVVESHFSNMLDYVKRMNAVTATIKFLLDYEPPADVNAHSGVYGTALQAAAYSGLAESTSLLLDRGARVACHEHEWCGKYGSALNAAVIKGHWDIVHLLREAGAKPHSTQKPDEEWLLEVREEDGPGAEERYRIFWELEKPIQDIEQTLLPRQSRLAVIQISRLLVPFQLFISFLLACFMNPKKGG